MMKLKKRTPERASDRFGNYRTRMSLIQILHLPGTDLSTLKQARSSQPQFPFFCNMTYFTGLLQRLVT